MTCPQVGGSSFVSGVLLVWIADSSPPVLSRLPRLHVPVKVLTPEQRTISARFVAEGLVSTDAVLSLDEDVTLISDELDFLYQVSNGLAGLVRSLVSQVSNGSVMLSHSLFKSSQVTSLFGHMG